MAVLPTGLNMFHIVQRGRIRRLIEKINTICNSISGTAPGKTVHFEKVQIKRHDKVA